MDITTVLLGTFGEIIKPYGVPVVIICLGTFAIVSLVSFILKKYNEKKGTALALHSWVKAVSTFGVSAVYSAIAMLVRREEFDIQIFLGTVISLAALASSAYEIVIKYFIKWAKDFVTKYDSDGNAKDKTPPPFA